MRDLSNIADLLDVTELSGYQSRWLKPAHIKPYLDAAIEGYSVETVTNRDDGESLQKLALTLSSTPAPMMVNFTQMNVLIELTGSKDPRAWVGLAVRLTPAWVSVNGKTVETISISRAPAQEGSNG